MLKKQKCVYLAFLGKIIDKWRILLFQQENTGLTPLIVL